LIHVQLFKSEAMKLRQIHAPKRHLRLIREITDAPATL